MTVIHTMPLIYMTVMVINGIISKIVVWMASATGIGYRHDGRIRFSKKLMYALYLLLLICH